MPHPVGCTLICLLPWSHGGSLTSLQTCQIMKQSLYLNAPWFPAVTREGEGRRGSLLEISRWSLEAPPSPESAQNPCLSVSLIVLADVEKLIFLYQSGFTPFVSKGEDPKLPWTLPSPAVSIPTPRWVLVGERGKDKGEGASRKEERVLEGGPAWSPNALIPYWY